ncbi:hypothetical protein AGRA3207_002585 [Actinomadura graeca]|uniref:Polyhydroxybutyrate depolymerase n=1 Tax=Actinomadura graeca TaxID=2750812 RepID=A0ABX8QSK7_9ACTN|nr:PHB depolymerase family esterase [Actinomadura graeca]QXJ21705.1 hypothetical protein AGRA3207_002585 [Actinomadura graeca]
MRRLLCLALAGGLVLAGCEGPGSGGAGRPDGGRPAEIDGIPTGAGTHKRKLDVGTIGHREYLLHVPPAVADGKWRDGRPADPPALVVALHGGLATMGRMRELTGFDALADGKGFLAAYPDGFMTTWNAGDCCGPAKIGHVDDVGFLSRMIGELTRAGLADPRRVYVAGFSNGAGMAYRLACERPAEVAAIGVVEGALATRCDPRRPVSVMIFHGTADRSVPFDGGGRRDIDDGRPFPPVSSAVGFWRKVGGLPAPDRRVRSRVRGAECGGTGKGRGGAEVVFCRIDGGGHSWPSGAAAALWDFFAAHPRDR